MLATLFFMWGFITVINNTLLPHLRSVFDLNYTQTTLIESVWFIAYFFASIPSAKLIERIGYYPCLLKKEVPGFVEESSPAIASENETAPEMATSPASA